MSVDITKYPQGPQEIIKHMDYVPEEDRMKVLMGFIYKTFSL